MISKAKIGASALAFATMVAMTPIPAMADTDVAQVGTTMYDSLQQAISAGQNQTVVLEKDVKEDVTIPNGTTLTINLNGHKLTGATDTTGDTVAAKKLKYSKVVSAVTNHGNLTITGDGTISAGYKYTGALYNSYDGTCVLNGGTFTDYSNTDAGWYIIQNLGKMTINEGTTVESLTSTTNSDTALINGCDHQEFGDDTAVFTDPTNANYYKPANDADLTINGGTFVSGLFVVKNGDWYAKATINGGTFKAMNSYVKGVCLSESNNCPMTVNGGTFSAVGDTPVVKAKNKTAYIGNSKADGLTINGGTFTQVAGNDVLEMLAKADAAAPVVKINGGTFNGTVNAKSEATVKDGGYMVNDTATSVTAGTFTADVSKYMSKDSGTTVVKPSISSIAVNTMPNKVIYTEGESFDPTGLVITITYSNGTTKNVEYNQSDFSYSTYALTLGTHEVQMTYNGDKVWYISVPIIAKEQHAIQTVGNVTYATTKNHDVKVVNAKGNKVVIPDTVTIGNIEYDVTTISKVGKNVHEVQVGSNVKTVSSKAFYKCKNLKDVTLVSKGMKIGSKAFKGVNKNIKVNVPNSRIKAYKKLLKKAGLPSTGKVY